MEKSYILIGGAPTTGKSTITQSLAERLNLPWISTDQLREMIKPFADKVKHPALFGAEGLSAEDFLSRYSAEQISDTEFKQGDEVWPAIKSFIEKEWNWEKGGIIEGVNILPHLVAGEDYINKNLVKSVFLVDLDRDRMRHVVHTRGLYDIAALYPDHVKEKEVEWAMMFTNRLKAEAEKYGTPIVHVTKTDTDIDAVLQAIGLKYAALSPRKMKF